jgi:hypothetical protein
MNPFIASYMLQNRKRRSRYDDDDDEDDSILKCLVTGIIIFVGILFIISLF